MERKPEINTLDNSVIIIFLVFDKRARKTKTRRPAKVNSSKNSLFYYITDVGKKNLFSPRTNMFYMDHFVFYVALIIIATNCKRVQGHSVLIFKVV